MILRAAYFSVASDGLFGNRIVITAEPGCKGGGSVEIRIPPACISRWNSARDSCCASHWFLAFGCCGVFGSVIRKDFIGLEPAARWHAKLSESCCAVRAEPFGVHFCKCVSVG